MGDLGLNLRLFQLKWWCPTRQKIRGRLFHKTSLLIGKDKSCDLILSADCPDFLGRIDFERAEIEDLSSGSLESFPSGQIRQIGETALQWHPFKPRASKRALVFIGLVALGFFLVICSSFLFSSSEDVEFEAKCLSFAELSELNLESQLAQTREAFEEALSRGDYRLSQVEYQSLKHQAESPLCSHDPQFEDWQWRLDSLGVVDALLKQDLRLATDRLERSKFQTRMTALKEEILNRTEKLYWRSWRDETRKARASLEQRLLVDELCHRLRPGQLCFDKSQ